MPINCPNERLDCGDCRYYWEDTCRFYKVPRPLTEILTLSERIEKLEYNLGELLKKEPMHKSLKTLVMEWKDKVEHLQGEIIWKGNKWDKHIDESKREDGF